MNNLVAVSYVAFVVSLVLRYRGKKEDIFISFFRIASMVVCLAFPAYYMISNPKEFSDLQIVMTGVSSAAVYNFLFSVMLHRLGESVNMVMITDAVKDRAELLAKNIVEARDEDEFERQRQEQLEKVVARHFEGAVKREIEARDEDEFERQRQEQLEKVVARDFASTVRLEAGKLADKEVEARFAAFSGGGRDDLSYAIWVGLHGASKALDHPHAEDEVLAIPYWVQYKVGEAPIIRRFNTCRAAVMKLPQVTFMSKQWAKVEGQSAIVIDGALISGVK